MKDETNTVGNNLATPELRKEGLEHFGIATVYPQVNTLDELKQQLDVLVTSGRGEYTVGITLTVDDDTKTIDVNTLPTV